MEMTATVKIEIENLKCGGCENSILKGLATINEISMSQSIVSSSSSPSTVKRAYVN